MKDILDIINSSNRDNFVKKFKEAGFQVSDICFDNESAAFTVQKDKKKTFLMVEDLRSPEKVVRWR